MVELTLLEFQVSVPINHQQQLNMVSFKLREDFIIDEVVWYGAKEEWDLVCLGEGEWGCTYILGVNCSSHSNISLR